MTLAERIRAGDRGAIARALTLVENGLPEAGALMSDLGAAPGHALRIGITGPPGAGKSTLVSALVREARAVGLRIAVLAVDPSSPFTHGALLGDRVRMGEHALDEGVFVRSLASRGAAGGLAAAVPAMMDVLDTAGCDLVIVETVGVGQSEVEVVNLTDAAVVVLAPNAGDIIQAMKAGLIEIGDLVVVNKSDLPGAEHARNEILAAFDLAPRSAARSGSVLLASATTGVGVAEILMRLRALDPATLATRRRDVLARRLEGALRGAFDRMFSALRRAGDAEFDRVMGELRAGTLTLDEAARRVAAAAIQGAAQDAGGESTCRT